MLRNRVRSGYGVANPFGPLGKLKPLSRAYIRQRERMKNLSSETSPSTSNLTKTGAMLDSIYYKVNEYGVIIQTRGQANTLKAIYTSDERPWANLSADEAAQVKAVLANLKP